MLATGKDAIPLYMQIKELLIGKISRGEWLPGNVIPSEITLSQELGVSQGTVRKAITDLVENNVLRRKQGLGTFVSNHDNDRALFHFFNIVDNDDQKVLPESRILSCKRRQATRQEAAKLQLDPGSEVVRIERVRSLASVPTIFETISLPGDRFAGLGNNRSSVLPNMLYEYYETQFGITIHSSEERLRAISASKRDATQLGVGADTPLLEIERVALTLDKMPVELRISRCSTRQHHYHNTIF
jgi:GntR family transcriptional regulator